MSRHVSGALGLGSSRGQQTDIYSEGRRRDDEYK
jgi:hypothetical protein